MSSISFFTLPAEIRIMIYKIFFANLSIYHHRRLNCAGRAKDRESSYLSLILANKQIHSDSMPLFYSETLLSIDRNVCTTGACSRAPRGTLTHSPRLVKFQHIEARLCDFPGLLRCKHSFKEVTLLFDQDVWHYALLMPILRSKVVEFLGLRSPDEAATAAAMVESNIAHKVTLQTSMRGRGPPHTILSGSLGIAKHIGIDKVVFERGCDVVIWGVEKGEQAASESFVRKLYRISAKKVIRFAGTPGAV